MLGVIFNSTEGHSETGDKIPNATGEFDRWIDNSNIVNVSHFNECRIILDENPAS